MISFQDRPTVSIPFVRGDGEGFFTAALIAEMNRMGMYEYVGSNGELELKVALVGDRSEVVGYRYDRSKQSGRIEPNLMATENRRHLAAEITLSRISDETTILGPTTITAFAEYDYIDVSTIRELAFIHHGHVEKVIDFSQGQLDSIEGAQDNALMPLYAQLAKRVVAAIQKPFLVSESEKMD